MIPSQDRKTREADTDVGDTLIELRSGVTAARSVREGLIDLAVRLPHLPKRKRGLLVLTEARMSPQRLREEWRLVQEALRPELAARLGVVLVDRQGVHGFPEMPDATVRKRLEKLLDGGTSRSSRHRLPRPNYGAEACKVLIHQWFMARGPMSAGWLADTVGATYPTIAKTLREVAPVLKRGTDRRFELAQFPESVWAKLLANADTIRHTLRYVDQSGKPRSPENLLRRLAEEERHDVAVGGVIGARHWLSDLDLSGTPRLDLTVHCPQNTLDVSFVERLDPGLVLVRDPCKPPLLVVHVLRRKESFFVSGPGKVFHADPVECLLDLHEAHLEVQAAQFLEFFERHHGKRR